MADKTQKDGNANYLSQKIGEDSKNDFNKLSNDLGNFAISKGLPQPSKGEILSKLIKNGVSEYGKNLELYFEEA